MFHFFRRRKKEPEVPVPSGPKYDFRGNVVSDVGRLRSNNEDNYILAGQLNDSSADHSEAQANSPTEVGHWQFAGVFDGMGGGEMGEIASRDTARIFLGQLEKIQGQESSVQVDIAIRAAFLEANKKIVGLQKEYKVFGTTGTVLGTNGMDFKLYHLGDSRAYLVRDRELLQLTRDQTLAQMKLEVGMYTQEDPAYQVDKHKLTEYIGRDTSCENIRPVESHWIPIQPGDLVLLCSDGLYDMCTDQQIGEILNQELTIAQKAAALVDKAIAQGGEDNVTCVVVSFSQ